VAQLVKGAYREDYGTAIATLLHTYTLRMHMLLPLLLAELPSCRREHYATHRVASSHTFGIQVYRERKRKLLN
jgi:hypothetical protein